MADARSFYDALADDYDLFVNWQARLETELPFLLRTLEQVNARRVLDVAGGTGRHALALVQAGYEVSLADISPAMVEHARAAASARHLALPANVAGFGSLRGLFPEPFDALLCLGNSIPHVLDEPGLRDTAADMAAVLRPGGLLVWQMRNFERVLALQERFMGPQSGRTETEEWLFIRFYDFIPPHVRFNMLKLRRSTGTGWQQQHEQTLLYPWRYRELVPVLMSAGWSDLQSFGSLRGEPYEPDASSDLVITARRTA